MGENLFDTSLRVQEPISDNRLEKAIMEVRRIGLRNFDAIIALDALEHIVQPIAKICPILPLFKVFSLQFDK